MVELFPQLEQRETLIKLREDILTLTRTESAFIHNHILANAKSNWWNLRLKFLADIATLCSTYNAAVDENNLTHICGQCAEPIPVEALEDLG